jgi:hypothetical protein
MSKENEIQFSTENLPFLLHYERYSLGWDSRHEGFFIDPHGNVYSYEEPYYWNSFIPLDKTVMNSSGVMKLTDK